MQAFFFGNAKCPRAIKKKIVGNGYPVGYGSSKRDAEARFLMQYH